MSMLRIYSDKARMPGDKNPVIMLYPFWGYTELPATDPDHGRFGDYISRAKDFFTMVDDIEEADVVVFPLEYDFSEAMKNLVQQAAQEAKQHSKKLLLFNNSDFDHAIPIDNSIVLRTSFYNSSRKPNEYAFPGWSNDFLKQYGGGHIQVIEKTARPSVSYCGYVGKPAGLAGLLGLAPSKDQLMHSGALLRGAASRLLQKNKDIDCRFIIRDGFWAQGISDKRQARRDYAENMLSSPYALVARGTGNFSYRLYEVLSCGRIPVFINTDCVLPYEGLIDWKKHMPWIEAKDIKHLPSALLEFHHSLSAGQFGALQAANRALYEACLSPTGFFSKLHLIVNDRPHRQ